MDLESDGPRSRVVGSQLEGEAVPGDIRKAKEVLKIVDELVDAAAKFQEREPAS